MQRIHITLIEEKNEQGNSPALRLFSSYSFKEPVDFKKRFSFHLEYDSEDSLEDALLTTRNKIFSQIFSLVSCNPDFKYKSTAMLSKKSDTNEIEQAYVGSTMEANERFCLSFIKYALDMTSK